jgi:hypothetical protein
MHSDGTLVIMVSCQEGLVVASDSRQTLDEHTFCDGAVKLLESQTRERFILAVTGRRGFYPFHLALLRPETACEFVKRTPREFDLGMVAMRYADADAGTDLANLDMVALSNNCMRELKDYLDANPHRAPAYNGDRFSSSVVLASFNHMTRTAIIRSFEVAVTPDLTALSARQVLYERFAPDDLAAPVVIGESDYLAQQVLPVIKGHRISATTLHQFGDLPRFNFPRVRDQSLEQAVDVATDLIEAASTMTATVPAPSGIGGPLDVRLLGANARPVAVSAPDRP